MIQRNLSPGQFSSLHIHDVRMFGDNLTVTTFVISKLTHFPPEYCVSVAVQSLVVYQKEQLLESLLPD